MPKTATDNVACIACGADVRSEALFCYNCGGAIASSPVMQAQAEIAEPNGERDLRDQLPDKSPIEMSKPVVKDAAVKTDRKPLTAAMLRRKRAYNRQPIEVVWEEPETHSMVFIIASVILTVLVVIILAAAFYLK